MRAYAGKAWARPSWVEGLGTSELADGQWQALCCSLCHRASVHSMSRARWRYVCHTSAPARHIVHSVAVSPLQRTSLASGDVGRGGRAGGWRWLGGSRQGSRRGWRRRGELGRARRESKRRNWGCATRQAPRNAGRMRWVWQDPLQAAGAATAACPPPHRGSGRARTVTVICCCRSSLPHHRCAAVVVVHHPGAPNVPDHAWIHRPHPTPPRAGLGRRHQRFGALQGHGS